MSKIIKNVPISMNGLALAFGAIGNLYENSIRLICFYIMTLILVLFTLKIIFFNIHVKEERDTYVLRTIYPTYYMTLLVFCTYLVKYLNSLSIAIWYIASIYFLVYTVKFTYNYIYINFNLEEVLPSWLIVYVGLGNISITSLYMNQETIGTLFFWFSLLAYLIILPIIIFRFIKIGFLPKNLIPLYTIFLAGPSVLILACLNTNAYSYWIVRILFSILCLMIGSYIIMIKKVIVREYYPTITAYAFPTVLCISVFHRLYFYRNFQLINLLIHIVLLFLFYLLFIVIKNIYFKNLRSNYGNS